MHAQKRTTSAEEFFYEHAGYSYGPDQTPEQGRCETATKLAEAEAYAAKRGWRVDWQDDPEPYQLGDAATEMPSQVLCAVLCDDDGAVLESLGGIGDPSPEYRRVVDAELALEAMKHEVGGSRLREVVGSALDQIRRESGHASKITPENRVTIARLARELQEALGLEG